MAFIDERDHPENERADEMPLLDRNLFAAAIVIERSLVLLGMWADPRGTRLPSKYTHEVFVQIASNPMSFREIMGLALIKVKAEALKDPADPANWVTLDEKTRERIDTSNKELWWLIGRDNDPCEDLFPKTSSLGLNTLAPRKARRGEPLGQQISIVSHPSYQALPLFWSAVPGAPCAPCFPNPQNSPRS